MKQKLVLFVTSMTLALSMSACGQTEASMAENGVSENVSVTADSEEAVEEATTELSVCEKNGHTWIEATFSTPKTCSVCGETEGEPKNVAANAVEKFQLLNDVYGDILDRNNDHSSLFLKVTQHNFEMFTLDYDIENGELEMYTADGNRLSIGYGVFSVLLSYYDNRINNNEDWYDIAKWVSQFETENKMAEQIFDISADHIDTNETFMGGVSWYASTILKADEITFGEPEYEIDHYEFPNGVVAYYTMPIIIDGNDYGLDAVFDEDGNLINVWDFDTNGDYSFRKFM